MQLKLFPNSSSFDFLDQYYTKKNIAQICTNQTLNIVKNIINLKEYIFLEPSAGYGVFYDILKQKNKKVIGFDIFPRHSEVKKINFLDIFDVKKELKKFKNKKIITIGNPPFGKKSSLAINFFNQATIFSSIISFILPNQFKKWSTHKNLNPNYKLIYEISLPKNAFYLENKKDYNVNSIFQIWTNIETSYLDKRIKVKPEITHKDFVMYQYNNTKEALKVLDNDFDFAVFSQGYGDYKKIITNKKDFDFKKHYLLFKGKNKQVVNNLKKIDFEKLSKNNTIIPGFRKNNIVSEYKKKYG